MVCWWGSTVRVEVWRKPLCQLCSLPGHNQPPVVSQSTNIKMGPGPHLHDLHVQQAQEAAAEAEAHGVVDLRLKLERRIVQLQLAQSLAQVLRW